MDGIGWFTYETMQRITVNNPQHQFFFLFDRQPHYSFKFAENVKPIVIKPITRLPFLIKVWHKLSVPVILKRIKPDIYISPDCFLPDKKVCPYVVIIHDLNFEHFPEYMPVNFRRLYKKGVSRAVKNATQILTVSRFSKEDIINNYNIPPEKIDVVFCGTNSFIKHIEEYTVSCVKQHYGINKDYFIVPGTLHPRKNTHGVIEAWQIFKDRHKKPFSLVFAGNNKWWSKEMKKAWRNNTYKDDIIFTGRVSDEDMNALVTGARAMVYASLFEGFGLPILEAAKAGIPVITSANSSMQEVAGKTALLVDPTNYGDIADAMFKLADDDYLCSELVRKSSSLIDKYSWERTARLIWESVERTASK